MQTECRLIIRSAIFAAARAQDELEEAAMKQLTSSAQAGPVP